MMRTYDYYRSEQNYYPCDEVDLAALEILARLTNDERRDIMRGRVSLTSPRFLELSIEQRKVTIARVKKAIQRIPFSPINGGEDEWEWNGHAKHYVNRRHPALQKLPNGVVQLHVARLHAYNDQGVQHTIDSYMDVTFPFRVDFKYPMQLWFTDMTYTRQVHKAELAKPTVPRQPDTHAALLHKKHCVADRLYIPVYAWDFGALDWRATEYVVEREPHPYVKYTAMYYVSQGYGEITLISEWFADYYAQQTRKALSSVLTS